MLASKIKTTNKSPKVSALKDNPLLASNANIVVMAGLFLGDSKMYPIQDGEDIPEWLAKIVYRGYVCKYGDQQSYERIRERGGFGKAEVIWLLSETCEVKTIEEATQALKL